MTGGWGGARELLAARGDPPMTFALLERDIVRKEIGQSLRQYMLQENERTGLLSKAPREQLLKAIGLLDQGDRKTCEELAFSSTVLSALQDQELIIKKGSLLAKQLLKYIDAQSAAEMVKNASEMLQLCTFFNSFGRSDVADRIVEHYRAKSDFLMNSADVSTQTVILRILLSKEANEQETIKMIKFANGLIDRLAYLDTEALAEAVILLIERFPREVGRRWKAIAEHGLHPLKLGQLSVDELGELVYAYKQFDVEAFWEAATNCVWNAAEALPAVALLKIMFAFGKQARGSDEVWARLDLRLSEHLSLPNPHFEQHLWLAYFGLLLANYLPKNTALKTLEERVYSPETLDAMDVQSLVTMVQMQSKMTQISPKHKQLALETIALKLGASSLETLQKMLNLKGK